MPGFTPEEFVYSQPPLVSNQNHATQWKYLFLFLFFSLCMVILYFFSKLLPNQGVFVNEEQKKVVTDAQIVLPSDAIQLIQCVPAKGSMYVVPSDLPAGPLYMVYHGQVVGIEFLIDKTNVGNANTYGSLSPLNLKINHVTFGLLPQGYGEFKKPYYFFDFYFVGKDIEQLIVCEKQNTH